MEVQKITNIIKEIQLDCEHPRLEWSWAVYVEFGKRVAYGEWDTNEGMAKLFIEVIKRLEES